MTKPDLKPCPFCGGDKNTICKTDYDGRDSYAVSCRYPECHGAIFTLGYGCFATKDEAIAAWNTRAIDPATIREAALCKAADVVHKWWFDDGNELPQELILALIGEKE
jgi:Lar family restriction alleviation protein